MKFLSLLALAAAVALTLSAAPARADDGETLVQVAQAGSIAAKVGIRVVCDRGRAAVIFRNHGARWNDMATLTALHPKTGETVTRTLILRESQQASFRLGYDQSSGAVVGRLNAPWLPRQYEAKANLDCQ